MSNPRKETEQALADCIGTEIRAWSTLIETDSLLRASVREEICHALGKCYNEIQRIKALSGLEVAPGTRMALAMLHEFKKLKEESGFPFPSHRCRFKDCTEPVIEETGWCRRHTL